MEFGQRAGTCLPCLLSAFPKYLTFVRGKRTDEPSESKWSSPVMNTRNPRGVINALLAFWEGYLMEGESG
ncbi:hypothetical protein EVAR_17145_1 [Eumeta japonica]|uniref:Uncharacterized protein n=1 Tax=Eumeta variegata TaxID=151549 RepID=A0A4C1ULU7_EUMVA|nr:hypothetical protein EVAR_17145_1 [Eumeta japonica]